MDSPKRCFECKHWKFSSGVPRGLASGTKWESWCSKGKWNCKGTEDSEQAYKEKLKTAENCKEFSFIEEK